MLVNGAKKAPDWLYEDMGEAVEIINDIQICKEMGWTFTELDDQPFYSVEVLRKWLDTEIQAKALIRKKQEKQAKKRGRGMRRRGRRRRG